MMNHEGVLNESAGSVPPPLAGSKERCETLCRLLDRLTALPDATTASAAACALVAGELADAGVVLTFRRSGGFRPAESVLADYPAGIGLADIAGSETMSAAVPLRDHDPSAAGTATLMAWRSRGDRRFSANERELLGHAAAKCAALAVRLIPNCGQPRPGLLDPETGIWSLPPFLEQADRRFDRLDVEDRVGTMFAVGWVRSDGSMAPEASPIVVRGSVACLQEMLRPADLIGRIAPARIAAWCDGVDHLIAAERGDWIVTKLDALVSGSNRHVAIGIATRWPQSGDDPATLLARARIGLEQARLAAATQARPAVRIWQSADS